MSISVWKFRIPKDDIRELPDGSGLGFSGCVAVALAGSEAAAREILARYGSEMSYDTRWLEVATVTNLRADIPATLAFTMI